MVDHYVAIFARAEVNFMPGPTAVVPPIKMTDGVHFNTRHRLKSARLFLRI